MLFLLIACAPLSGTWEGEADCDGTLLPIEVWLEPVDGRHEGWGSLDCTPYYGEDCLQSFDIEAELDERDIDVDIDNCVVHTFDGRTTVGCDEPDDLEWDGADAIEGEWGGCEVELERG